MSPNIMKKMVYIRYEKKYRKWMIRFGISVSEEKLKKEIEEDGANEYTKMKYRTKTWLSSNVTK